MSTELAPSGVAFEHVETPEDHVVVPAGTYIVGDPCYTVAHAHWMDFLRSSDPECFAENSTGGRCKPVAAASIDGHVIVSVGTADGDGGYDDGFGGYLAVDSGRIGLVPIEYAEKHGNQIRHDLVQVITFPDDVECTYEAEDEGSIHLGDLRIVTDPDPEEHTCWTCGRRSDSPDWCTWGCDEQDDEEGEED